MDADPGHLGVKPTSRLPSSECLYSRPPSQVALRPASGASRAGFSLNGSAATSLDAAPRAAPQQEADKPPPRAPSAVTPPAPAPAAGAAPDDADSGPPPSLPFDLRSDITMKTAEVAATKIQAGFRGYKVRRQLREQSLDQSKEGGSSPSAEQSVHSAPLSAQGRQEQVSSSQGPGSQA